MRLNFSNLGKGLEAIAGAKQARDLAEVSKSFENNITEGAYGPALGENLQQVIGARDQALQGLGDEATPEQRQQVLDQYTPAMSELSRRVGLQAPDYSVGGAGVNYATRDQANIANAGLRAEALGKVYRQYGDVDRADALEARALEQRRGLATELRAQEVEGRAKKQFETQNEAALLTIEEQRRQKKLRDDEDARQKENAAWWVKQTTDPATGERRAPKPEDFLAASQRDAASYYQTGNYEKGGQAYDAFMSRAEAQILKEEKDRKRESQVAFDAVLKGDYKAGMNFYNKFLPNGSIATSVEPGKDGTLKVSHTDLSGNKLPDTTITRQQLLQGIASYGDSDKAMKYIQQSFSNNLALREAGQKDRSLALQERNVVVNEDTAQFNKIQGLKRDAREDQRLNQPTPQTLKQYKDREGNAVLVDITKLPVDKNGVVQTPKGLVPVTAQTEPSYRDVASAAAKIMEDPKQNKKMVDGKKVPITFEEAAAKARVGLAKQNAASGEDPADRIIRLMKAAQAGNAVDSETD